MKRLILLLSLAFWGLTAVSQNTSPLVVKDFMQQTNGIMDIDQVPKDARVDFDSNPVCMIMVKAVGFDESLLQKFIFVPNGLQITHKTVKDGMAVLYVSSNKMGDIVIKHMGDCTFTLPYKLEANKIYVLTLSMETATLVIRTVPAEADIYVDNQRVGTGEGIAAVSLGAEHRYKIMCDLYYTKEGVVKFDKQEEKSINVELEPNFSYIIIKSVPSGADVYVDEKQVGTTPYQMKKIQLGTHVVELKKQGYDSYADIVTINKGEINKQLENVTLTVENVISGTLEVTSNVEGANIVVNDEFKGTTPNTFEMPVGTYTVTLSKEGCLPDTKTVTITEGRTTSVALYLQNNIREISISTGVDGDKVYIDEKYVGVTPLSLYLTYGQHTVKAVRDDLSDSKTITVSATGGTTSVQLSIKTSLTYIVNGVKFEMVFVKAGTFTMGATAEEKANKWAQYEEFPAHKVTLTKDYYVGKYEVTQALWKAVMGYNPSYFTGNDNRPVENITYVECLEFINKLNGMTGLTFRLPTEAEWEYAARGGNKSEGLFISGGGKAVWCYQNSGKTTHPVGELQPNELGIYDMSGNVTEMCQDGHYYYTNKDQIDPVFKPVKSDKLRQNRGGSYLDDVEKCRVAARGKTILDQHTPYYGFRLVLSADGKLNF